MDKAHCSSTKGRFAYLYYRDDYDSELLADDDSKPLTQDELKSKVMKLVSLIANASSV